MWYRIGMMWLLVGSVFGMLLTYDLSEGRVSLVLFAMVAACLLTGGAILYGVARTGCGPGSREEKSLRT